MGALGGGIKVKPDPHCGTPQHLASSFRITERTNRYGILGSGLQD